MDKFLTVISILLKLIAPIMAALWARGDTKNKELKEKARNADKQAKKWSNARNRNASQRLHALAKRKRDS